MPSKNCKSDQEINPKTGRCIKKCPPGTIRSSLTGKCIKGAAPAPPAPAPPAPEPEPPVMLPIKIASSTKKKCPQDKEINPKTGRCVKKCAPGTIRNLNTGKCIKGAAPPEPPAQPAPPAPPVMLPIKIASSTKKKCPQDKEINPKTGRCVKKCAPGTVRSSQTGKCIKAAVAPKPRAPAQPAQPAQPAPQAYVPQQVSPNSLVTSADVRKRALFLNTICSDSGICLAFGKEDAKIKKFFDGFNTFTYTQSFVNRVGAVSANGFVNMLEYDRKGYKSHAILKSSKKSTGDNLYYEFLTGYYFINKQKRRFPCFVETYGLFKYNDLDKWTLMQEKHKVINDLGTYLQLLSKDDPHNVAKSCTSSKLITVLIENIKGAETVSDMIKDLTFVEIDLLNVLFQVYAPLSHLAKEFTHYDLHTSNVLVHKPFGENEYIEFHYHLKNGETISFKSKYIAKIIDYGRSYYTNKNENVDSSKFYYSSDTVRAKVCSEPKCNLNFSKCGNFAGYGWLNAKSTKGNHYISSNQNNISHDLRFLSIVSKYIIEKRLPKIPVGFQQHFFDKIAFTGKYGTKQLVQNGYKEGKNNKIINNVYDGFEAIKESIKIPIEMDRNEKYYQTRKKVGDLHIYFDGQDMRFDAI